MVERLVGDKVGPIVAPVDLAECAMLVSEDALLTVLTGSVGVDKEVAAVPTLE